MQWPTILIGLMLTGFAMLGIRKSISIVQRRAFESAEDAAAQERVRFLQRLDHELKNPLAAMQIALANLDAAGDMEKRQEIQQGIRSQVMRMSRLIGDLRKLALLDKALIEQERVDVGNLLHETLQDINARDDAADRYIVSEFAHSELPEIVGDRDLLQMAIYNLLDNAVKFTRVNDVITLRAYSENDMLVIEVHDTGPGIMPEDLPHIWEDLYRSKSVQGIPGSGIGLALVKGVIERHAGAVDIVEDGKAGVRVTIKLPINRM